MTFPERPETLQEMTARRFLEAHIARFGAINTDQLVIDRCKLLADMTLSHRRAN